MARKLSLLIGFGAGYLVGARAGRERYDKVVATARRLWRDPRVQAKAQQAQHVAKEKAEQVGHAAAEKAADVQQAVGERVVSMTAHTPDEPESTP
jgi:hypothetical protein